jgi:tetratricopeptide (TPR) repeat protein
MKTFVAVAVLFVLIPFPSSGQTQFEKAVRLYDDGNTAQSKRSFLEAVKEDPRNAEAYYYLGVLSIQSDYEGAIDYLRKAVELADTSAKYHLMLGNAYGSKAQRAGIFSKFSAATNCKEQYLAAISLDPKFTEARMSVIEYYLQAPGIIGGSIEKAVAEADTIKTYDPYAGYLSEGRVHEYQKESAQQEQCYLKAISSNSRKLDAYRALWLLYVNQNNGTKADEVFKKAAKEVDDKSGLYYLAGLYYLGKNDLSTARSMFETALKKDPGNFPVYYQLGKTDLLAGTNLEHGLACFERFLNGPHVKGVLGPEYAYWRIGMTYEKLGKKDSARTAYQKSLELNPDLEESKTALEKLK